MKWTEFAGWGRRVADWAQEYHLTVGDRPVRAQTRPGEVLNALPAAPPEAPEDMEQVFRDFEQIVMPGITHWQHPRFFAYFNSTPRRPRCWRNSSSPPSRRNACCGRPLRRRPRWKPA